MPKQQLPTAYTEAEILNQLDQCAEEFRFPILNSIDSYYADIRLTSFRSSEGWLIVFEEVSLYEEYLFTNNIFAYANKLRSPGLQLGIDDIIQPVRGKLIFNEDGSLALDLFEFEIKLNGKRRRFTPTKGDYRAQKINLRDQNVPDAAKLLRYLVATAPEEFFQPDKKLLQICGRKASNAKVFLRLEDWHHPDVADGELPSESITFRSLARALVQADPNLYSTPKKLENTHWTKWKSIL
jgi:hypothetical protein